MTVKLYQPGGSTVRRDRSGIAAVETGMLTDITALEGRHGRSALEASGLPRYGDAHPAWPDLKLVDIILTATDSKQWRAQLTYREPSPEDLIAMEPSGTVTDVEWFAANVTVSKLYDAHGNRMFHYYSGRPTTLSISGGTLIEQPTLTTQLGVKSERADVQIPSIGVRVTMVEDADPRSKIEFVGKINSSRWSGEDKHKWLFVGPANGALEHGRWTNSYELLFRTDGWDLESVIEFNGAPPSDATVGNGIAIFQIYEAKSFSNIGFEL